jgi:hypothetical protein
MTRVTRKLIIRRGHYEIDTHIPIRHRLRVALERLTIAI